MPYSRREVVKNGMTRKNNRRMPVPELCMQKMRAPRKEAVTEVNVPDTLSKAFLQLNLLICLKSSCVSDHFSPAVNFNLKFVEGVTSVTWCCYVSYVFNVTRCLTGRIDEFKFMAMCSCEHIQKSYACSLLSVSFNSENLTICFRYPVRCDISCYVSYDTSKFE